MSDEGTEEYITRLFAISPRAVRGTASAKEWLEFIDKYNEHDSHVVLNERQKKTIEPYCTINDDVEMTPDDFLKLIRIVRHETPPSPTLSNSANLLNDARPRSSRLVGNRPTPSFSSSARMRNARLNQQLSDTDDDKDNQSLDHPDAESDDISLVSVSTSTSK
jgi:hypothetical protein